MAILRNVFFFYLKESKMCQGFVKLSDILSAKSSKFLFSKPTRGTWNYKTDAPRSLASRKICPTATAFVIAWKNLQTSVSASPFMARAPKSSFVR